MEGDLVLCLGLALRFEWLRGPSVRQPIAIGMLCRYGSQPFMLCGGISAPYFFVFFFFVPQAELLTIQTELLMGCFFRCLILLPGLKIYSLIKLKKTAQRKAGTLACCLVGCLPACLRLSPIFLVADVDEGILIFFFMLLLLVVSFAPYLFPSHRKCWQQQVLC